jgi:hypothetical protein
MTRGLRFYLVGSVVLVALAGCGRGFFQVKERDAWRHEAEVQCLKSGAVRESSALVRISPIEGPGICGADFPLKVAALGESTMLGFADDMRPPGAIPNASSAAPPRWPIVQPRAAAPMPESYAPPPRYEPAAPRYESPAPRYELAVPGEPLSLRPPGAGDLSRSDDFGGPYRSPERPPNASYPANPPPSAPVPLGPARGPQFAAAGPVEVKPAATLACPIVSALDQWVAGSVQPAAMRWFGQPVVEIKQISAYSCRGMNGEAGAPISEHAFGNALDIAAFTLADGRQVVVQKAWSGLPEEQGFLHDVQGGACQEFSTVLAPGSNRFHYNHIHVDLMRRASGRRICQPAAIPGEVAAARAGQRNGFARRGDPGITGSIAKKRQPPQAAFGSDVDDPENDLLDD